MHDSIKFKDFIEKWVDGESNPVLDNSGIESSTSDWTIAYSTMRGRNEIQDFL